MALYPACPVPAPVLGSHIPSTWRFGGMGEPGPATAAALLVPSTACSKESSGLQSSTSKSSLDAFARLEMGSFPPWAVCCSRAGVIEHAGV